MTSPARISANQDNAKHSTGPRSPEGKERSKMNALKHGLRAETIVLPTEDPAEFDAMLGEWMDEWDPPTGTRRQLVRQAVAAAWRVNRSVRVEAAALSVRANKALDTWDRRRDAALDANIARLMTEPRQALQGLKGSRHGVARLIALWEGLVEALAETGGWFDTREHHATYLNLRGYTTADPAADDLFATSWRLLLANRPDLAAVDAPDTAHPPAIAEQVRKTLAWYAQSMVEMLRDAWSDLPDTGPERLRQADLAAYAFGPYDLTLQRYEGRLDREFRANLTQLMALTKSGLDLAAEVEAAPIAAKPEPVAPKEPKPKTPRVAVAPNEANANEPETPSVQVERDRGGRIWPVEGVLEGPIDDDRV
jgi:hypothetical protein